jgi:hypothetical protein
MLSHTVVHPVLKSVRCQCTGVPLMGNVALLGGAVLLDGVQLMGASELPGTVTFTPGLIVFPPMIVAPMLTASGPTAGGTNVSNPDGACVIGGAVAALAPLRGAARLNRLRAAAAAANL